MPPQRPSSRLTGRLDRIEAARQVDAWRFTLTDGTTASLPMTAFIAVMNEATAWMQEEKAGDLPPLSRNLLLVARLDPASAKSVIEGAAAQFARAAQEASAA